MHVGSPHRFDPGAEDAPVGETNLCIPQTAGEAADYSAGEEGTLRRALRGARGLESGPPHTYYILRGIVFRRKMVSFTRGVSLILVSLKRGRLYKNQNTLQL